MIQRPPKDIAELLGRITTTVILYYTDRRNMDPAEKAYLRATLENYATYATENDLKNKHFIEEMSKRIR